MRSPLRLGIDPDDLEVHLSIDTPFQDQGTYEVDGVVTNWPAGTTLSLIFGTGASWAATVVGAVASWNVAAATADAMPHNTPVRLFYTDSSGDEETLSIGRVIRHDR